MDTDALRGPKQFTAKDCNSIYGWSFQGKFQTVYYLCDWPQLESGSIWILEGVFRLFDTQYYDVRKLVNVV